MCDVIHAYTAVLTDLKQNKSTNKVKVTDRRTSSQLGGNRFLLSSLRKTLLRDEAQDTRRL